MSNFHRFSENVVVKNSFVGALANSTQAGTGVDCLGYRRAAIIWTTYTGSATTSNFTVSESADNSTNWLVVAGLTLAAAVTASNAGTFQVADVDLSKRLRYLRVNIVGTGTAGAAVASILLLEAANLAQAQDVAALTV